MKREEIRKECAKELGNCYDKLNKRFCEGKTCIGCVLQLGSYDCVLNILYDLTESLQPTENDFLRVEEKKTKPVIVKGVQCRSEFADILNINNERMKLRGE